MCVNAVVRRLLTQSLRESVHRLCKMLVQVLYLYYISIYIGEISVHSITCFYIMIIINNNFNYNTNTLKLTLNSI